MARKPKDDALKKAEVVTVRFTRKQLEDIRFAANHENRELSDWLRRAVHSEALKVKERAARKTAQVERDLTAVGQRRLIHARDDK